MVGVAFCSRVQLEESIDFVSNFHLALQFTHTISDTELPFLDINLHISDHGISTSVHYKVTHTHSYIYHQSSHPRNCKESLPKSQLLRLRRLCSDDSDFQTRAQQMASFFERRGYNARKLQQDLDKMRRLSQSDALQRNISLVEKESRIPLVLTYHPPNNRTKRILLDNFKILSDDPETKWIFPQPPMVAYRPD